MEVLLSNYRTVGRIVLSTTPILNDKFIRCQEARGISVTVSQYLTPVNRSATTSPCEEEGDFTASAGVAVANSAEPGRRRRSYWKGEKGSLIPRLLKASPCRYTGRGGEKAGSGLSGRPMCRLQPPSLASGCTGGVDSESVIGMACGARCFGVEELEGGRPSDFYGE